MRPSVASSANPAATRLVRHGAIVAALLMLCGCGQKGALYLPSPAPAASAPASR